MFTTKMSAMKVLVVAAVVGAGLMVAARPANAAGLRFGISIGLPVVTQPVYVAPAPVVVAPTYTPVYAPAPVYVQPVTPPCVIPAPIVNCPPVYVAPRIIVPDRDRWDWRGHDFHGFDGRDGHDGRGFQGHDFRR